MFRVETPIRTRNCCNCGIELKQGVKHIRFSHGKGMYNITKNLCKECLKEMWGSDLCD